MNCISKERKSCITELNKMALPLIAGSITSILMGIIDQAFIGHISLEAYAGVGLVYSCINSLVGVLGAFSIVFNICGSNLKGRNDLKGISEEFSLLLILCGGIGFGLFILFNIFCNPILHKGSGLTGKTLQEASEYLRIFSFSIPLNLVIFLYSSVFKIFKKTNHIFATTLFINILGVCLDYILIYGKLGLPAFGAKGAALGSILSLIVYLGIYSYTARHLVQIDLRIPQILKKIKDKIRFSIPFLAQEFMEDILFVVGLNMIVARIGTVELSAYNLILQIISIIQMPMFGYSTATVSLVSEAFGNGSHKKAKQIKNTATLLSLSCFALMFLVLINCDSYIITFISDEAEVVSLAQFCLPASLLTQLFNYGLNIEKSALQSINESRYTLHVTFTINMIILCLCGLLIKNLLMLYVLLGIGYAAVYLVLYHRSRRRLSADLR